MLHIKSNGICHYCEKPTVIGKECDLKATVDHYIPISRGGWDSPSNWVLACWKCNNTKANLMPNEFASLKLHDLE